MCKTRVYQSNVNSMLPPGIPWGVLASHIPAGYPGGMIPVTQSIALRPEEVEESFIHASGPGGQHVNKAATAVQLRFNIDESPSLSGPVKRRLKKLAGNRVTNEGDLVLEAREHRSRKQNRAEAQDRLVKLIRRAAKPPKPRKKTRPSLASKKRRLENKRRRSEKKQRRKPVRDW